jgi:hypothetical protein
MQDTTDLKSDILNEINFNKSILSEKRRHNFKLKKNCQNSYDN